MVDYDNGKEESDDRGSAEDDLAYKAGYSEHSDVLKLLDQCQESDQDNREAVREAHIFLDKRDGQWEPEWSNNVSNVIRLIWSILL